MVGRVPVSERRSTVWRYPGDQKVLQPTLAKRASSPDLQIGPGCYANNGKGSRSDTEKAKPK